MFPLRILIVDSNVEFLESAAQLLRLQSNVQVVRGAVSGSDALEQIPQLNPNLVLVNWGLPGLSCLELTRIVKVCPQAPYVIIFSLFDLPVYHTVAKEAGADGLICSVDWKVELFGLLEQLDKTQSAVTDTLSAVSQAPSPQSTETSF